MCTSERDIEGGLPPVWLLLTYEDFVLAGRLVVCLSPTPPSSGALSLRSLGSMKPRWADREGLRDFRSNSA